MGGLHSLLPVLATALFSYLALSTTTAASEAPNQGAFSQPSRDSPNPALILSEEHELIQLVLFAADDAALNLQEGEAVDLAMLRRMVDFFSGFVERCHNTKEEQALFPRLLASGDEAAGHLVAVLKRDHDAGRRQLAMINDFLVQEHLSESEWEALGHHLGAYAWHLNMHIERESRELMPAIARTLDSETMRAIVVGFERIEREDLGAGFHEAYHRMALNLVGQEVPMPVQREH